jgi:hypothetical protein
MAIRGYNRVAKLRAPLCETSRIRSTIIELVECMPSVDRSRNRIDFDVDCANVKLLGGTEAEVAAELQDFRWTSISVASFLQFLRIRIRTLPRQTKEGTEMRLFGA